MPTLAVKFERDSAQFEEPGQVVRTPTAGGFSRFGRDQDAVSWTYAVAWSLDAARYAALRTFYEGDAKQGGATFTVSLSLETFAPSDHTAQFVPASFQLDSVEGGRFNVSATLEVFPLPVDDAADMALINGFVE